MKGILELEQIRDKHKRRTLPLSFLALIGFEFSLGSDSPPSLMALTLYSYSLPGCTFSSLNWGVCN